MTVRWQPYRRSFRVPGWIKLMAAGGAILFLTHVYAWAKMRGWA